MNGNGNERRNVLWMSNAPWAASGYGNQTALFTPLIHSEMGSVDIAAFWGLEGAVTHWQGMRIFPRAVDYYMNDVIQAHYDFTGAELLITLVDAHVHNPEIFSRMNWCAWAPVDSEPDKPVNSHALQSAKWVWAMSRFGEKQLKDSRLPGKIRYVPHGVNTDVFRPVDRGEARARLEQHLKVPLAGRFLVMMNSANTLSPARKGFAYALDAFRRLCNMGVDAVLYLHTEMLGMFAGENLPEMVRALGVDPERVRFAPHHAYVTGMLSQEYLNNAYNAADVFLHTSKGEGFGIPIVEAQAAGCPVLATDFSAMSELVGAGRLIESKAREWMRPGVWMAVPDAQGFADGLWIQANMDSESQQAQRDEARYFAMDYDYRRVWARYMRPAIKEMLEEIEAAKARAAARKAQREVIREA